MRFNLFAAQALGLSRRKADTMIQEGKIKLNGKVVREPFVQVSDTDKVEFEGETLKTQKKIYVLFNKPKGVTTTLGDRFAEKTVFDCLPVEFKGLFPVGRLDKDSKGLLILTNDGDFCYRLTHPKFEVEKEYLADVMGNVTPEDCRKAVRGIEDEGDILKVKRIKLLKNENGTSVCAVTVCASKRRHIRRIFKALGHMVCDLKRVRIGALMLNKMKAGEYMDVGFTTVAKALKKFQPDKRRG